MPVDGCPNVYHCGFSSKDSFGSAAYLIVRSDGNILVDSPRFDRQLLTQIQVNVVLTGNGLVLCLAMSNRFTVFCSIHHVTSSAQLFFRKSAV